MKKVILSIAIALGAMFNANAQVYKNTQTVKDGAGNKVSITMTVLSEPSEGAFMSGFNSQYTDLVCCGEVLADMDQSVLVNRIASNASTTAKYACNVKASWVPKELVLMWNESSNSYFGTIKGTASNAYGVVDEVKVIVYMESNGDLHR